MIVIMELVRLRDASAKVPQFRGHPWSPCKRIKIRVVIIQSQLEYRTEATSSLTS